MITNVLTCAALFYAASFIDLTGAASYRKHHSNTGSCENDEVFVPVTRSVLASSWNETREDSPLYQIHRIAFMLVVGWMPGYLFFNATGPTTYWGKSRSHFNPNSAIYAESALAVGVADRKRWMIVLSDIFLVVMLLVPGDTKAP